MWVGPDVYKLAVITEKMSFQGSPFEGNAGKMFKDSMVEAGIDVGKVAFGYATDIPNEDVQFLVLAGDKALATVRPDLKVRFCHGRPMLLENGAIGFPVFNPEAYWRNPRWRSLLAAELQVLLNVARNRDRWEEWCPQSCVRCRGEVYYTDPARVAYCEVHKP
jgi:hypothetical protein